MAIEIVSPLKIVIFHSYFYVYQRVTVFHQFPKVFREFRHQTQHSPAFMEENGAGEPRRTPGTWRLGDQAVRRAGAWNRGRWSLVMGLP